MDQPKWIAGVRKIGALLLMGGGLLLIGLFLLAHFGLIPGGNPEYRLFALATGIIMLLGGYFQFEQARKR